MDIPLDHFGGRLIQWSARSDLAVSRVPLEWAGLAARLAAAHAARHILAVRPNRVDAGSGSFSPAVAQKLGVWRVAAGAQPDGRSSPGVNLDTKADGKLPRPIGRSDAGESGSLFEGCHDRN